MPLTLLILGGTAEASRLATLLAGDARFAATLSLAGRTTAPNLPRIATRVGGFGGAAGLADYLRRTSVDVLIDATHPFAEQISANAVAAARTSGVRLIRLTRAPWRPVPGDRWTSVRDLPAAAAALPTTRATIFLTVGRQSLGAFASRPEHCYIVRAIDPPDLPKAMAAAEVIYGRGPFQLDDEIALLKTHRVDIVVTKNSGGEAAYAKLAAARTLALPVILVEQPGGPDGVSAQSVEAVLGELVQLHGDLAKRSV